eukprot:scaffold301369_cov54-Prasinocladus_malaysianus.AAC.2
MIDYRHKNDGYGYSFYLWRLALFERCLGLTNMEELLTLLMKFNLDTTAVVRAQACWNVFGTPEEKTVSMLMLALEFIKRQPAYAIGPPNGDWALQSASAQLVKMLLTVEDYDIRVLIAVSLVRCLCRQYIWRLSYPAISASRAL